MKSYDELREKIREMGYDPGHQAHGWLANIVLVYLGARDATLIETGNMEFRQDPNLLTNLMGFIMWINESSPTLALTRDRSPFPRIFVYLTNNSTIKALGNLSSAANNVVGKALGMTECPGGDYADTSQDRVAVHLLMPTGQNLYATVCPSHMLSTEAAERIYRATAGKWNAVLKNLGYSVSHSVKMLTGTSTLVYHLARKDGLQHFLSNIDVYKEVLLEAGLADVDSNGNDVPPPFMRVIERVEADHRSWSKYRVLLLVIFTIVLLDDNWLSDKFVRGPGGLDEFYRRIVDMQERTMELFENGVPAMIAYATAFQSAFGASHAATPGRPGSGPRRSPGFKVSRPTPVRTPSGRRSHPC